MVNDLDSMPIAYIQKLATDAGTEFISDYPSGGYVLVFPQDDPVHLHPKLLVHQASTAVLETQEPPARYNDTTLYIDNNVAIQFVAKIEINGQIRSCLHISDELMQHLASNAEAGNEFIQAINETREANKKPLSFADRYGKCAPGPQGNCR